MSLIEQHIVDHCHTAQDVIEAALAVQRRRRELWPRIHRAELERQPTLMELVDKSEKVTKAIESELNKLGIKDEPPENDPPYRDIKISHIHRYVARKFGIDLVDLRSDRRTNDAVIPRHVSFLLCRILTKHSFPEIGRRTGGRDHSTVIHGINKYRWLQDQLRAELTPESPLSAWVNRAHELVKQKNG